MRGLVMLSILLLPGCALIYSGRNMDEHIQLMQERNAVGCSYLAGSGTPPASRVDGAVVGGWGQDMDTAKMLECLEQLKGLQ
jgi:hypothetical protein